MKRLLQINSVVNTGSTGRISEEIGLAAMTKGWGSTIAYGRYGNASQSQILKIGNQLDNYWHVAQTRFFDKHGLASKKASQTFLHEVKQLRPDLIHLHNIHGYYINYELLFSFLKSLQIPVVWTLHDCWSFTGHCTHFEYANCEKWKTHCHNCPESRSYPKSYVDRSYKNFEQKKAAFTNLQNLTLVPVSKWLERKVKKSFLAQYATKQIYTGVDLSIFRPTIPSAELIRKKYGIIKKKVYLGVASTWTERKGLADFEHLAEKLRPDELIVLVGLTDKQIKELPANIIGIRRTENVEELAQLYNISDVLINPTLEDTFPTVNIEALACGTPIITYRTGGSPEAIDENTGWVVPKGDIAAVRKTLDDLNSMDKEQLKMDCRLRAEKHFDKKERFQEYTELYEELIK